MIQILALQDLAAEDHAEDEMPLSTTSWSHCGNTL